ncbi:MAG TPA: hypothetical protein PLY68_10950 [Myxococcota bacterium]|nr:hypothetical protein [Myxococcota bacterium]
MDGILNVLQDAAFGSLRMLLYGFGPVFLVAFLMAMVSGLINRAAQASIGYKAFIYMTAPGTVVHELGHAVFCLLFRHKINEISLFKPEPDGTLGYVKHSYNAASIYQRVGNFYIATGPIWFGCVVVYLLSLLLIGTGLFSPVLNMSISAADLDTVGDAARLGGRFLENLLTPVGALFTAENAKDWKFWVFIYLTISIGIHMTLSPADLKGGWPGFLLLLLLILIFNALVAIVDGVVPSAGAAGLRDGVQVMLTSVCLMFSGGILLIMSPALALMILIGVPMAIFRHRA